MNQPLDLTPAVSVPFVDEPASEIAHLSGLETPGDAASSAMSVDAVLSLVLIRVASFLIFLEHLLLIYSFCLLPSLHLPIVEGCVVSHRPDLIS